MTDVKESKVEESKVEESKVFEGLEIELPDRSEKEMSPPEFFIFENLPTYKFISLPFERQAHFRNEFYCSGEFSNYNQNNRVSEIVSAFPQEITKMGYFKINNQFFANLAFIAQYTSNEEDRQKAEDLHHKLSNDYRSAYEFYVYASSAILGAGLGILFAYYF